MAGSGKMDLREQFRQWVPLDAAWVDPLAENSLMTDIILGHKAEHMLKPNTKQHQTALEYT
jgi:hypothetical protein